MFYRFTFAALSFFILPHLACSLFTPIVPSASSVIKGNTELIFQWVYTPEKDTAKDPFFLSDALCHLMWGNEERQVTLLAYNVHPVENMVKVYIRADYGFNSSQYYIRYRTNDGKGIAYSERFMLINMNGPDFSLVSNGTVGSTSHGSGGSPPVVSSAMTASRVIPFGNEKPQPTGSASNLTPIGASSSTPAIHGNPTPLAGTNVGINGATSTYAQPTGALGPFGTLPSPSESPVSATQSNGSSAMSLTRQKDSVWKKISLVLGPVMIGAVMAM